MRQSGLSGPAGLAGVTAAAGEFVALRVPAGAGARVSRSGSRCGSLTQQPSAALLTEGHLTGGLGGVEAVAEVVHDVGGGVVLARLGLSGGCAVAQVTVGGGPALQL